jgi:hypothetical protein
MTASSRTVTLLSTLLLAAMPVLANAAEQVRWPIAWKAGEVSTYDTESVVRDSANGGSSTRRITDHTRISTDQAGDGGYALTWTTRDSRIEAVEGDRSMVDTIAPMLDELDGMAVEIELDRSGHYRRVRNLDAVIVKVRAAMLPVFLANLPDLLSDPDPKLSKYDRDTAMTIVRSNLQASIDSIVTSQSVETMSSAQAKTMTMFSGRALEVGKQYRDAEPIESPTEGRPLPASREYVLSIVKGDPELARIRWTQTLDPDTDAKMLWALADELTGNAQANAPHTGRPSKLVLRKEGVLVFRRDTGAVEMLETTEISRYGTAHDEHERYRMRRSGSTRTWAQEDADAAR